MFLIKPAPNRSPYFSPKLTHFRHRLFTAVCHWWPRSFLHNCLTSFLTWPWPTHNYKWELHGKSRAGLAPWNFQKADQFRNPDSLTL